MTLLDASTTLIDAARQLPENRKLSQAIKRMEKRIQVLRIRALKALRRRRWSAWYDACAVTGEMVKGPDGRVRSMGLPRCNGCWLEMDFAMFCREAEICGRGHVKQLYCPGCGYHMLGYPEEVGENVRDAVESVPTNA